MKKVILSAALLLTIAATNVFATGKVGPNEKVKANFKSEFIGAESVVWTQEDGYHKASFTLDEYAVVAYFNEKGDLMGSLRTIEYKQLPLSVTSAITKKFENAEILSVYEINNEEGTSYRITLASEGKTFRVKSSASGSIIEKERLKA